MADLKQVKAFTLSLTEDELNALGTALELLTDSISTDELDSLFEAVKSEYRWDDFIRDNYKVVPK